MAVLGVRCCTAIATRLQAAGPVQHYRSDACPTIPALLFG
jgi:hypothetical protein